MDETLVAWVRQNALSQYHMAGTCKMGLDELSVVDPALRVYGVQRLRVVDASVMPRVVSGHCQAAVFAIAERAAHFVKQERQFGAGCSPLTAREDSEEDDDR